MSAVKHISLVLVCGLLLAGCGGDKSANSKTGRGIKIPSSAPGSAPVATTDKVKVVEWFQHGKDKRVVANGDQVWIIYKGYTKAAGKGKPFDQNQDFKRPPYTLTVGQGMVIKGWDQEIVGKHVGDKWKMEVPPSLAYGSETMEGIPPNSTLIFEMELAGLVKTGEDNVIDMVTLKPGTGTRTAKVGDSVSITMKSFLSNGVQVKAASTTFVVGKKTVLPCIEKGVQGMKVGGMRKIIAPPLTAYINSESSGIPANSLVFVELTLNSIK
jgi:FKBP-type peptidyl-prolyl cis-trans isomerase